MLGCVPMIAASTDARLHMKQRARGARSLNSELGEAIVNEHKLRMAVGFFLVISHFGVLVLVFSLHFAGGFSFSEMTTTVGLIAPLFAGYTSVILAFIVKNKDKIEESNHKITASYAVMSFFLPLLFVCCLTSIVVMKSHSVGFANFDDFKVLLALIEGAFGVYVGQFIYSMFEAVRPNQAPGTTATLLTHPGSGPNLDKVAP